MTTITTQSNPSANRLLYVTLIFDMLLCASFGVFFLVQAGTIAAFLGISGTTWFVMLLGITLLAAAAIVFTVTFPMQMNRRGVWLVFALNTGWVIASLGAVFLGVFTTAGAWSTFILADIVATVALLEWLGLRR